MYLLREQIETFQKEIFYWYKSHKRDLPWRKNRDPYAIFISEVMLQQTQVSRVILKYQSWMSYFPTVISLAVSPKTKVLQLWSGLGYNRRAIYLLSTAKIILEKYNGVFPDDERLLIKLPGIGEYTSRAIACFAFDKQIAVVDTNVKKVIITKFLNVQPATNTIREGKEQRIFRSTTLSTNEIQQFADQLLPYGRAYEWNQALMDYSSAVLKNERITIPKQSRFKDSDRFYRGKIIKILLQDRHLHIRSLYLKLNQEGKIDYYRLQQILKNLEKDTLIHFETKSGSIKLES